MCLGVMPRGQGARRVLTRQDCDVNGAKDMPFWASPNRTQIAHLDAAFGGVGGDRCRLYFSEFGEELSKSGSAQENFVYAIVRQTIDPKVKRHIFAVKETMNVPRKNDPKETAPNQIARFCMEECGKRGVPPENFIFCAGMRTSLVQSFSRIWSVNVQSVDSMGSASADRPVSADNPMACKDFYANLVTEFWWSVRMVVLAGQMRNMGEDAIDDFANREWGRTGKKTQIEPKQDMKKKIGRSPDDGDALSFGIELARRKGFVIRKLKPANEPPKTENWKRKIREDGNAYWRAGRMPLTKA
jgi:hypothetical protein